MVLIIEHTWVAVEQCYDPTRQPGLDHHVSFKAVVKSILDGPAPSLWPFSTSGPDDRVPCIDAKQLTPSNCHVLRGQPTSVAPPTIYVGTPLDPVGILLSLYMTEPPRLVPPQYGADPIHSDSPPQLLT